MGKIDQRLAELGITLPEAAKPVANYVPWVRTGNLVFISGQGVLPERDQLLIAMADLTPDIRAEVEALAAERNLPLAPLYAALLSTDPGNQTPEAQKGSEMRATPRKGARLGGGPQHERALMSNLVSSLIASEAIVTTEAKAKALRPIAEKVITKARKGGLHNHRQVLSFLGDQEITAKLMDEVGPRYRERNGGYTRILKLGTTRRGDNAPMARIELV